MKKLYTIACLLCIAISLSFTTNNSNTQDKTLTATFKGVTETDFYSFEDTAKKEVLFYDMDEEIEINLYDDDYIGKKFKISWLEKEIDILDEEGESTGEKTKVKSITALEIAK